MTPARPAPRRAPFYLAVAAQALFLLAMVGIHLFTLQTGERILLKTVPVDPRDLFRGDYVRLNYEISELDAKKLAPAGASFKRGDAVWVLLQRGERYWQAVRVSTEPPTAGPGQVAVRARVRYYVVALGVSYGIETFFVPEGQGRELENRVGRPVDLDVEVAVDRFGNAAIARVLLNGKEVKFD